MAYILDEFDSSKLLLTSINILLQTINELPIEDEDGLQNSTTGQLAEMTLVEVKRAVLSEGWDFNTDKGYTFPIDINNIIAVPANVLDITATSKNVVMRDWKLYDRDQYTFEFDEPVKCDVIWDMDFNTLTHPMRHYITIRGARVFQSRTIGDQLSYAYTEKDEEKAYASAKASHVRTGKYNMLSSTFGSLYGGLR